MYLLLGFGPGFGPHIQFWIWTFISIYVFQWYFEKLNISVLQFIINWECYRLFT